MKRRPQLPAYQDASDSSERLIDLESDIVKELAYLEKFKKRTDEYYHPSDSPEDIKFDKNGNYYDLFWKLLIINLLMASQLKQLSRSNAQFEGRLSSTAQKFDKLFGSLSSKTKKKNRRLDTEIAKEFACPYPNCFKAYGSTVSLNLHMKIKHNAGNKTERENLGKQYLRAIKAGLPPPEISISFPPGFLQDLRKQMEREGGYLQNPMSD